MKLKAVVFKDTETHKRLKKLSADRGVSIKELVHEAILDLLSKYGAK